MTRENLKDKVRQFYDTTYLDSDDVIRELLDWCHSQGHAQAVADYLDKRMVEIENAGDGS